MNVNRIGYYKWNARKGAKNRYEQDREDLTELLQKEHAKRKIMGYHALVINIRNATGWVFSDNLAHRCCKDAGFVLNLGDVNIVNLDKRILN